MWQRDTWQPKYKPIKACVPYTAQPFRPITFLDGRSIGGTVVQCLSLRLIATRSWVRFPQGDAVGAGGVFLLRVISAHTLGGVGNRAFLCGVCMFSPCLLGLIPSQKHARNPGLNNASPWPAGAPDGGERNWLE